MPEKEYVFEDGSLIRFIFNDNELSLFVQARNLDKENKVTSTTVMLNEKETSDLLCWIGKELIKEE